MRRPAYGFSKLSQMIRQNLLLIEVEVTGSRVWNALRMRAVQLERGQAIIIFLSGR